MIYLIKEMAVWLIGAGIIGVITGFVARKL